MGPEKVKDMTTEGRESRVRDFLKSGQMKNIICSLPPTIISSFTGARGINILYLDPPGINLTSNAGNDIPVLVRSHRRSAALAGRSKTGSVNLTAAYCGTTPYQDVMRAVRES